jgi:hypothetical protein
MGLIAYRAYWKDIIIEHIRKDLLENNASVVCVKGEQQQILFSLVTRQMNSRFVPALQTKSGVHQDDIISTLQSLFLIKYYKGRHYVHLNSVQIFQKFMYAINCCRRHSNNYYVPANTSAPLTTRIV